MKAQRIAYVIDYSQSMSGAREKLMREELAKSVSELPPGMLYQPIFFSGPVWMPPMQMALRMDPPPQVIYFMTDGIAGPNSDKIAEEIAKLARNTRTVVNTVALMEPRAKNAMITLAEQTGGQATMVTASGERETLERKR